MSVRSGGSVPPSSSPLSNFTKLRKLGEGGFGKVFLVQDKRDGIQYCMKEIDLSKLDAKGRKEATKECAFLARMAHPNIISYKEWFEIAAPSSVGGGGPWGAAAWNGAAGRPPPGGSTATMLYIVMSYADGGDLEARIKAQQKLSHGGRITPFPEQEIVGWFIQIALAIKHIHDRKILHRDIKSQNVFLTKANMVKLGDFGIARDLSSTMAKAMTQIGTPFYLSPEICAEKPYDAKSDIWALGIVLYELMCLKHPFSGQTMKQLLTNIVNATYPPPPNIYSRPLMDLVAFLLQKNPKNRPSINQLLRFPFIQQHIGRFLSNNVIQEEFSHTILHGNLAGGGGGVPKAILPNKEQALARAHALHAQQEAEQRARDAQQAQRDQRDQQIREQQARDAAKAQAIARAKALAVEQAEKARQAHIAALRAQHERQRAEDAARLKAQQKLREQREQQLKEQRDLQAAKDAANRREAQRRADERARQVAQEREEERARRERERDAWRDARDANRANAQANSDRDSPSVAAPRRSPPPASRSPAVRPPWVGVDEDDSNARDEEARRFDQLMREARREEDRRIEERERARMAERDRAERIRNERRDEEERARERERAQRDRQRASYDRDAPPDSCAPTMVRPRPNDNQREREYASRNGQYPQHQQQQQQPPSRLHRAASAAELPPSSNVDSRSERAAKQRAHEDELAKARKEYFEERKRMEQRRKEMLHGDSAAAAAVGGSRRDSPPRDDRTRVSPPAAIDRREAAPQSRDRSSPPIAESHEEQLARARKEYYEERKALEARQKAMRDGPLEQAPPVDRNERPLGGGGGGMRRTASEAVFDRPSSSAGARDSIDSKPSKADSPDPDVIGVGVSYRRGAKYGKEQEAAMAAKEAELARIRVEFFEERKQLALRKQQAIEEMNAEKAAAAAAAAPGKSPSPDAAKQATPTKPTPAATTTATPPPKKSSLSDKLAADRAAFFAAQRAAARSDAATQPSSAHPSLPSASASPLSTSIMSDLDSEPEGIVDSADTQAQAERSIDELAADPAAAEQMVQLMQTMRNIMLPSATGEEGEGEEDAVDGEGEEEEEEYTPPVLSSDVYASGSDSLAIDEGDQTGVNVDGDGDGDGGDDDDDVQPESQAEASAVGEWHTFRANELRAAVASALAASAQQDLKQLNIRRDEQGEGEGEGECDVDDADGGDSVGALPASSDSSRSDDTALYNSSATLPPNRLPNVGTSVSNSHTTDVAHSDDQPVDSSMSEGGDPMSYKVESLRLFLSDKLGDDLLLDIYRLLRRTIQHATVQSVHTVYSGTDPASAHSSPATTLALGMVGAPPNSARRGSVSSLVINNINVRELLNGSGLLDAKSQKYISLIQQLIKAEHQLYGQL